jgi:hypothetical protein
MCIASESSGLSRIVPPAVLPLLTWYEVRGLVCGRKPIDLDLLQANTEYDDDGKFKLQPGRTGRGHLLMILHCSGAGGFPHRALLEHPP